MWPGRRAPQGLTPPRGLCSAAEVSVLMIECTSPTSCPERLRLPPTPCHRDRPSAPALALMDGPHTGFHTSPSSPEAPMQVIGVASVDCMPVLTKQSITGRLGILPLTVWVRGCLELTRGPQRAGGNPGRGSRPTGPVGANAKDPAWRMCHKPSKRVPLAVWDP